MGPDVQFVISGRSLYPGFVISGFHYSEGHIKAYPSSPTDLLRNPSSRFASCIHIVKTMLTHVIVIFAVKLLIAMSFFTWLIAFGSPKIAPP